MELPRQGIDPVATAVEAQSLNHETSRHCWYNVTRMALYLYGLPPKDLLLNNIMREIKTEGHSTKET